MCATHMSFRIRAGGAQAVLGSPRLGHLAWVISQSGQTCESHTCTAGSGAFRVQQSSHAGHVAPRERTRIFTARFWLASYDAYVVRCDIDGCSALTGPLMCACGCAGAGAVPTWDGPASATTSILRSRAGSRPSSSALRRSCTPWGGAHTQIQQAEAYLTGRGTIASRR